MRMFGGYTYVGGAYIYVGGHTYMCRGHKYVRRAYICVCVGGHEYMYVCEGGGVGGIPCTV